MVYLSPEQLKCRRTLTICSASKCAEDNLGISVSSIQGGSLPKGVPCMDKMPGRLTSLILTCTSTNKYVAMDASSLSGGAMPDLVPLLNCACKDAKIDAAI